MKKDFGIKQKRVMSYFIESAAKIMTEKGVDTLTIRNVAEGAGYNSATLYNYFEDLDELKKWASIYCITEYFGKCCDILKQEKDSLENLMNIWLTYCNYAFHNPQLYTYIFFSPQSADIQQHLRTYSEVFPDWLGHDLTNERIRRFVTSPTTEERISYLVELCVDDGYFMKEDMKYINDIASILTAGLLQDLYAKDDPKNEKLILNALDNFKIYFKDYINNKRIK